MEDAQPKEPRTSPRFAWVNRNNAAVLFAVLLSFGIIIKIYGSIYTVEQKLPQYGFLSIRELHAQLRDLQRLKDMVLLSKTASASTESRSMLSEAADLAHIRFARVDRSRIAAELPGYSQLSQEINSLLGKIDALLGEKLPFDRQKLEAVESEITKSEAALNELYFRSGEKNNAGLIEAQRSLARLNIEILAILVILSSLLIGVAVLFVQRQRVARQLRHVAWHDTVTGLKNRAWLMDNGQKMAARARAGQEFLGLFIIDLDHFKKVNDTFGHFVGDALLREVATVMSAHVKDDSTAAIRLGGDEFAFLKQAATQAELTEFSGTLCQSISGFRTVEGHQVRLGASIGCSICPDHSCEISELLKHADMALYSAKAGGRQAASIYSPQMQLHRDTQLQTEEDLKQAIRDDDFFLVWQPQLAVATGQLTGAEALLRWNNQRTGELIQPMEFIPIAETSELILEIDKLVLRKACDQAAQWLAHLPDGFTISVNISGKHLQDRNLPEFVGNLLETTGVPARLLELELTERIFIEDKESAHEVLSRIRRLGVRIALDDFGTGYSSLGSIADLEIDRVKIDQTFIANVCDSTRKRGVVHSILAMCEALDIETVAEGIEAANQFDFLIENGCTYAQGFFLAEPLSEAVFSHYFSASRKSPETTANLKTG